MKRIQRFTLGHILLITLLAALPVQGSETFLSVRTLAVEEGDMPVLYIAVKDQQFEQLEWPTLQPSAVNMALTDGELLLYSKETNQKGEPEFKLARKVAIPEAASEVLLLGWTINDDAQAELLAIADNYKKAKFNDWLVINRSDLTVTLRYGKDNDAITLESGEAKFYQIKGERDKGGEVIAEAMIKGKMKKMYSTFWAASDKQRSLVLFTSKDDRAKLHRIIDFLHSDKESER